MRGNVCLIGLLLCCIFSGRIDAEEPTKSAFAKKLSGRNESVRLLALAPIRDDVAAKLSRLDDLIYCLREHADQIADGRGLQQSTVELIAVLASIDRPDAHQALIEMLDCPEPEIAMICADALGHRKIHDAIDSIKAQVERPEWKTHYGFRFNLIRSLAQMDHPDAYEFMNLIAKRIDGQLLHELNQIFKKVTLDDFHGDEERFENWRNGGSSSPTKVKLQAVSYNESAKRMKLGRSQYYGIDINAKRSMFIIDHSGSMKAPVYRGTRLTRAKAELMRVIKELPNDNEFGIIFFESSVRQWRKELLKATDANKKDAVRFISNLGYGGSTNTYGALRSSLDFDDDLEAVFFLSDGIPTTGSVTAPAAIVNDIVLRNRLRHLKINTIGIGVTTPTRNFLKTLAEKCGGEYTEATRR